MAIAKFSDGDPIKNAFCCMFRRDDYAVEIFERSKLNFKQLDT